MKTNELRAARRILKNLQFLFLSQNFCRKSVIVSMRPLVRLALLLTACVWVGLSNGQTSNMEEESISASPAGSKPAVAVYVSGDMPVNEKKVLGTYLLTSLINTGRCLESDGSAAFLTAIYGEQSTRKAAINDSLIFAFGKQFGVKYVCIVSVNPAFGFFTVSARIAHTGTGKVFFSGEAPSPLKTMDDLSIVSNKVVENMFGVRIFGAQVGVELNWGAFAVGANLRLGYAYNSAQEKGSFDYAIGAGPSYVKRSASNE